MRWGRAWSACVFWLRRGCRGSGVASWVGGYGSHNEGWYLLNGVSLATAANGLGWYAVRTSYGRRW